MANWRERRKLKVSKPLRPGTLAVPVDPEGPLEPGGYLLLPEAAQALGNEAWAGVDLEVALVGRRRAVLGGFLYGEGQAFLAFLDPKEAE